MVVKVKKALNGLRFDFLLLSFLPAKTRQSQAMRPS